jgi:hypothetical protein
LFYYQKDIGKSVVRSLKSVKVNDIIKKVNELPVYLRFVSNEYLVDHIKEQFKETKKYDSFFIKLSGEQFEEIWGMYGKNPDVNKYVYRISLHRNNR